MAKIVIDGTEHDFSDEFDIGEARVIKRYTGLNLQQLEDHDPTDPDLIAACVHIVFRREQPNLPFSELEKLVDAVQLAAIDMVYDGEEVGASPPAPSAGTFDSETTKPSNGSLEASPEMSSREPTGLQL